MAKENIRSKTARAKLRHKNEPYWDALRRGLHLGYRTSSTGVGTWVGRLYHSKRYHHTTLDDQIEFDDARKLIEKWADNVINGDQERQSDPSKPVTVEDACRAYVTERRASKGDKTAYDASNRFERLVYGKPFGRIKLTSLKESDVTTWRNAQLSGAEDKRKAKDSINRNLKSVKAALNATKISHVRNELKDVKYFAKVAQRRQGWLNADQRNTLLASMSDDLKQFATALSCLVAVPANWLRPMLRTTTRIAGSYSYPARRGRAPFEYLTRLASCSIRLYRIGHLTHLCFSPIRESDGQWTLGIADL